MALTLHDPALLLEAHNAQTQTLLPMGELAAGREQAEQGIAVYSSHHHRSQAFVYGGYDAGMACFGMAGWGLWLLGYPDQALSRMQEALSLAQDLAQPFTLSFALMLASMFHYLRREVQETHTHAERLIEIADTQGFATGLAWGTIMRGWAVTEQGQAAEGRAELQQGLLVLQLTGLEMTMPHLLAMLAEVHEKEGDAAKGQPLVAEALALVNKNEERWHEAELYRLYGELTLRAEEQEHAQTTTNDLEAPSLACVVAPASPAECFRKAIYIAQQQQAKSLELRATMCLARLWQQQGKKDEARAMLAEIYNWFTEGFDTKDLQEAKVLLGELSSP